MQGENVVTIILHAAHLMQCTHVLIKK